VARRGCFVVAGAAVAAVGSGWSGLVFVVLGLFVVALLAWMRRIEPLSYDVGDACCR
jgi:hypothetical protein